MFEKGVRSLCSCFGENGKKLINVWRPSVYYLISVWEEKGGMLSNYAPCGGLVANQRD